MFHGNKRSTVEIERTITTKHDGMAHLLIDDSFVSHL